MEAKCLERGGDRELCPRGRYRHFSPSAKNVFLGKRTPTCSTELGAQSNGSYGKNRVQFALAFVASIPGC